MVELHGFMIAAAALIGLLIGSFLNVCIYRLPRDLSVVQPRSFCPECGAPIAWYDNVPVLSYTWLRGRCRRCRQAIGWRYPLVEILASAAFAAVAWRYGSSPAALKWYVFEALLIVLFFTDLEERLLPDVFTIGGAVLGLVFSFFVPVHGVFVDLLMPASRVRMRSVLNAVFGGAIFSLPLWAFAALYEKIRKVDEAMGLGDVKLLVLLGVFLGFDSGVAVLLIGCVTGSVFGVIYVLVKRVDWRTAGMPFGSFLCLGGALLPLISSI